MNTNRLHIPKSEAAQVQALERMLVHDLVQPAADIYAWDVSPAGLRIKEVIELYPQQPPKNPLAEALARKHAQLRCLQLHLVRVLWLAFVGLSFCLIRSMTHHHFDWILAVPLWVLTTSCVPLLLMATQDLKEVRKWQAS